MTSPALCPGWAAHLSGLMSTKANTPPGRSRRLHSWICSARVVREGARALNTACADMLQPVAGRRLALWASAPRARGRSQSAEALRVKGSHHLRDDGCGALVDEELHRHQVLAPAGQPALLQHAMAVGDASAPRGARDGVCSHRRSIGKQARRWRGARLLQRPPLLPLPLAQLCHCQHVWREVHAQDLGRGVFACQPARADAHCSQLSGARRKLHAC